MDGHEERFPERRPSSKEASDTNNPTVEPSEERILQPKDRRTLPPPHVDIVYIGYAVGIGLLLGFLIERLLQKPKSAGGIAQKAFGEDKETPEGVDTDTQTRFTSPRTREAGSE